MNSRQLVDVDPAWREYLGDSVRAEFDLPPVCSRVVTWFDDAVVVWTDQHQVRQVGRSATSR